MEAGRAATDSINGVAPIQKHVAPPARLIVAAVATGIAAAIAGVLTFADFSFPVASLCAWLAVVGLAVGLLRQRGPVFPCALAVLGLVAVIEMLSGILPTTSAPLLGAGLLASAEFGYWSFEFRARLAHTGSAILRRAAVIVSAVVVGGALSGAVAAVIGVGLVPSI